MTTNKSNLDRHEKTHDKQATVIECTQCGETFANIRVLNKHKKAHENKPGGAGYSLKCSLLKIGTELLVKWQNGDF